MSALEVKMREFPTEIYAHSWQDLTDRINDRYFSAYVAFDIFFRDAAVRDIGEEVSYQDSTALGGLVVLLMLSELELVRLPSLHAAMEEPS